MLRKHPKQISNSETRSQCRKTVLDFSSILTSNHFPVCPIMNTKRSFHSVDIKSLGVSLIWSKLRAALGHWSGFRPAGSKSHGELNPCSQSYIIPAFGSAERFQLRSPVPYLRRCDIPASRLAGRLRDGSRSAWKTAHTAGSFRCRHDASALVALRWASRDSPAARISSAFRFDMGFVDFATVPRTLNRCAPPSL